MKTKREKKEVNKFDLEKFKVAKLKNLHLIKGGGDETKTGNKLQVPSRLCD
ncbi:hypothetical protein [Flavobacterium sp. PL02]|uniref:hypothetical protein n=1 Tax=Flavobacterium sp. PL02 TaxID=3088354 RepID=UPI002B23BCD8|nr:hypothetical protein [Flavobacterium sp. PL02]MEA9413545.1 hypothetical protein [Flavobacterium sp. PL02]